MLGVVLHRLGGLAVARQGNDAVGVVQSDRGLLAQRIDHARGDAVRILKIAAAQLPAIGHTRDAADRVIGVANRSRRKRQALHPPLGVIVRREGRLSERIHRRLEHPPGSVFVLPRVTAQIIDFDQPSLRVVREPRLPLLIVGDGDDAAGGVAADVEGMRAVFDSR